MSSICQITAEGSQLNLVVATNLKRRRSFRDLLHSTSRSRSLDIANPWEVGELDSLAPKLETEDVELSTKPSTFNCKYPLILIIFVIAFNSNIQFDPD